jgi:hypothetical protein
MLEIEGEIELGTLAITKRIVGTYIVKTDYALVVAASNNFTLDCNRVLTATSP